MSATGSRGFTLLELLVVLTIIALIASAWPLASSHVFANQHLREECQKLASAVRAAQMRARTTGQSQELTTAREGTSYLLGTEQHTLPAGITLQPREETSAGTGHGLLLFPDGSSSGGTLELRLHEHVAALRVYPATGRIEVLP